MKLLLDILQGAGLATSAGLRPFLPALAAGALASGDLGVDFEGTDFAFLEEPWFLLVLALGFVASVFGRRALEAPTGVAGLQGIGIGLGALLCAASIDDRHDTWWYGLVLGAALAAFAGSVSGALFARVRERFRARGDEQAAAALPVYLEGAALASAGLSVLAPPFALVAAGFLVALATRGSGSGEKYAGLRILR